MRNAELEAMQKIAELLVPFEPRARSRILEWVTSSLEVAKSEKPAAPEQLAERQTSRDNPPVGKDFSDFADLYHEIGPKSERDKALVAAYWALSSTGVPQFTSQQINKELKDVGYGSSNITDALSQLISSKPSYISQLKKSGSSRQARKIYKITDAGIRHVRDLLASRG